MKTLEEKEWWIKAGAEPKVKIKGLLLKNCRNPCLHNGPRWKEEVLHEEQPVNDY